MYTAHLSKTEPFIDTLHYLHCFYQSFPFTKAKRKRKCVQQAGQNVAWLSVINAIDFLTKRFAFTARSLSRPFAPPISVSLQLSVVPSPFRSSLSVWQSLSKFYCKCNLNEITLHAACHAPPRNEGRANNSGRRAGSLIMIL